MLCVFHPLEFIHLHIRIGCLLVSPFFACSILQVARPSVKRTPKLPPYSAQLSRLPYPALWIGRGVAVNR